MIAATLDWMFRQFERYTVSPRIVQAAARCMETLAESRLDAKIVTRIQTRRLRAVAAHAYRKSLFYRETFDRAGLRPADIRSLADLRRLPFTTPKDIRDWRQFLCVPEEEVAAVFATSGTTGEPKRVYFSRRDMQGLTNFAALAMRFRHPGRLVVMIALPMGHGLWIGSGTSQRVIDRAGGLPLPIGAGDLQSALKWMQRFEPNVVISSPSYVTALTRQAERAGFRLKLDKIILSGEALTLAQKKRFHDYWNADIYDTYGSTEIGGGQTMALPGCSAFHFNDLHLITEIIDPETGEPADDGELVFTTLLREAVPLFRYRSGDRGRRTRCTCRLPFQTIQLVGRTDDMFVAGDMNFYGNVIAEAVAKLLGANGRLEIRLDKVDLTDRLTLRLEGNGIEETEVRQALFDLYPELPGNIANGNLILVIEPNVRLDGQIKALKIVDARAGA